MYQDFVGATAPQRHGATTRATAERLRRKLEFHDLLPMMLVLSHALHLVNLLEAGLRGHELKDTVHAKDAVMPKYAELIYNGFWFSPEREMLQAAIDKSQKNVSGTVRAKLYKGNVIITGRKSPFSLYNESLVTFEEGTADYNHSDAEGFIKLNALRLRVKKMIENSS